MDSQCFHGSTLYEDLRLDCVAISVCDEDDLTTRVVSGFGDDITLVEKHMTPELTDSAIHCRY